MLRCHPCVRRDTLCAMTTYLDTACMGRAAPEVMAALRSTLDLIESAGRPPTDLTLDLYAHYQRARQRIAELVHVDADDIALVESTSHGLGLVAAALDLRSGDNVLACDLEFFPTTLCWTARRRDTDLEVRRVDTVGGRVRVDDFAARLDDRTRAIVVSSVQEINGFRVDLAALSDLTRSSGCLLIVDGVQEVGALEVDLSRVDVDAYCAGGHKWLRSPFGLGFLYVAPALAARLEPPFYSYFNAADPEGGWGCYLASPERSPFDDLPLRDCTQKFETGGTGNYLGALALAESVGLILAEGPAAIEARVLELQAYLAARLAGLGLANSYPTEPRHRAGITSFQLPGGPAQECALGDALAAQDIYVSVRYTSGVGGVRVSPHTYNDEADIDRLVEATEHFLTGS